VIDPIRLESISIRIPDWKKDIPPCVKISPHLSLDYSRWMSEDCPGWMIEEEYHVGLLDFTNVDDIVKSAWGKVVDRIVKFAQEMDNPSIGEPFIFPLYPKPNENGALVHPFRLITFIDSPPANGDSDS